MHAACFGICRSIESRCERESQPTDHLATHLSLQVHRNLGMVVQSLANLGVRYKLGQNFWCRTLSGCPILQTLQKNMVTLAPLSPLQVPSTDNLVGKGSGQLSRERVGGRWIEHARWRWIVAVALLVDNSLQRVPPTLLLPRVLLFHLSLKDQG